MPFKKCNVQFHKAFGSSPRETTITDEETGITRETTKNCNEKLPDAENFEIANQLKAGVNLQETNTKILGSKINEEAITAAIKKARAKKTTTTNNNETQE